MPRMYAVMPVAGSTIVSTNGYKCECGSAEFKSEGGLNVICTKCGTPFAKISGPDAGLSINNLGNMQWQYA